MFSCRDRLWFSELHSAETSIIIIIIIITFFSFTGVDRQLPSHR